MNDEPIFERINRLASEEEELWERAGGGDGLEASDRDRLQAIEVQLDQCYDLLHQRDARRAAGLNPDDAKVRSPEMVEGYEQ